MEVKETNVATCGTCNRSWDAERCPTPASLCPFCNGDEKRGERWEVKYAGRGIYEYRTSYPGLMQERFGKFADLRTEGQ